MAFRNHVISVGLCLLAAVSVYAAKPMKLPQAHIEQAEAMIEANLSSNSSFSRLSLIEARSHSPLASCGSDYRSMAEFNDPTANRLVNYASRFLGTRYRLGASGPSAFDCSGFVGYVYRNFGISLSRSSREQYLQGEKVSLGNLRPGDLLFFSSRSSGRKNVGHVAMVVSVDPVSGTCKFIHASSRRGVTYQKFPDAGYYESHFLGARRILGTPLDTASR